MKILNKENNQVVMYVQQKNIKAIIKYEHHPQKSLLRLAKALNLSDMDETHDEDFVRLTDKKAIEYVSSLHWIPEYKELRDLSDEELAAKAEERAAKLREIQTFYATLDPYEQRTNYQTTLEYSKINQTLKDINAYLWTRQGKYSTPVEIPLVIDGTEGIVTSNGDLMFGQNLEHNKLLIGRKDGQTFPEGYHLDPIEVQMGLMLIMTESNLTPNAPGEVKLNISNEPTRKYLVADYSFAIDKDYVQPVVEEPQQPTRIKPEQKKKSLFQRVFKPKQKDEN